MPEDGPRLTPNSRSAQSGQYAASCGSPSSPGTSTRKEPPSVSGFVSEQEAFGAPQLHARPTYAALARRASRYRSTAWPSLAPPRTEHLS